MKMLRLTQISCPDFWDGQPTPCFVNPESIIFVVAGASSFIKEDCILSYGQGAVLQPQFAKETHHPRQNCTILYLAGGHTLSVVETPEEVNERRNALLRQSGLAVA